MAESIIRMISNKLLDTLYPPGLYCNCCGKITDDTRTYGLCNDCMRDISWINGRSCVKCGKAMSETDPGEVCFYCRNHEHIFDKGYACAEYGAHEKAMLYELKYASRGDIGRAIGEIVYDRMAAELGEDVLAGAYDAVIPVPAFKKRRDRRGFNQAEVIASSFSEYADLECRTDILIRVKETKAMKGLGPSERRANIHGAFKLKEQKPGPVKGRRLLLIDDIYTTGATIDEAASVLKSAGAARVDFAVFAAGADIIHA